MAPTYPGFIISVHIIMYSVSSRSCIMSVNPQHNPMKYTLLWQIKKLSERHEHSFAGDGEWKVIPKRGKSISKGVKAERPKGLGEPKVVQSGGREWVPGEIEWEEKPERKASETQRALNTKLTEES